jgi:hypothetical protein
MVTDLANLLFSAGGKEFVKVLEVREKDPAPGTPGVQPPVVGNSG